eukprot:TRINITY_DN68589_c0_g1_i1.p1 TRINITY_DN68589_c0_g1~~TRINITY_DN68589_c0_g1_i1.p1  ORF type:complete len:214 (+),score=44.88 TRINITY_DN68589_c0_g1_i1:69-644(+)
MADPFEGSLLSMSEFELAEGDKVKFEEGEEGAPLKNETKADAWNLENGKELPSGEPGPWSDKPKQEQVSALCLEETEVSTFTSELQEGRCTPVADGAVTPIGIRNVAADRLDLRSPMSAPGAVPSPQSTPRGKDASAQPLSGAMPSPAFAGGVGIPSSPRSDGGADEKRASGPTTEAETTPVCAFDDPGPP